MERDNAPFLQIADACAYGFRRFLASKEYGQEYLDALLGAKDSKLPMRENWSSYSGKLVSQQPPANLQGGL
jgi:hypothetical protein